MEKRIISLLLTLVMVFSVLASVDLSAYAVDSGKSAHTDYSNLTPNQYLAMIFTNHNYNGTLNEYGANNDYPPYNIMQNYYMDANKASRARIIFNEFNAATDYKTTRGLYELLSFSGGSAVEKVMELEDYYTAILLSIVDVQMSQKNFVDDLNCKTNKTILTLSSNISKYLESTSKFENTDFMNTLRTEDLSDADFQAVLNICAADMDAQELFILVGKDIGIIKKILSVGDTINESVKNIADFAQLANLNTATKETLHQIYMNCPDDNLPMKNAARKVYEYTSGQMSYEIMSMSNAGYTACKYAMSEIVGDLWKSCLTAVCGEMTVGVLIGQAVGKLISNYCFATDAVDEQLCAISALVDFEDVMVAAVRSLEDTYKSNSNVENSENYVTSLRMLMSTYDLGCEYVEDFVDTVYTKGFINNVQFNNSEEYNTWKTVIADQKVTNEKRRELLYLPYYKNVYAIDAPSAYTAYFIGTDFQYKVLSEKDKTCEITGYTGSSVNLNIPSVINEYMVKSIGKEAFSKCKSLLYVTIPESVTSIAKSAFDNCDTKSYNFISVPSTTLKEINVDSRNRMYASIDGVLFNKNKTELILYPAGRNTKDYNVPNGTTSIGKAAFRGCTSLTSITIPTGVTSIGDSSFQCCTSLISVIIPNSVTILGEYVFADCSSLKSIILPYSVTTIGSWAFRSCASLTSVTIPNSVTSMGSAVFWDCTNLTSVTLSDSMTNIGAGMFYACISLIHITIPDSITSIGEWAFIGCTSLTSITIPISVTSVGESSFQQCTSLTSVTIPDSVTSIGDLAFEGCISLTNITIPNSVSYIGKGTFADCIALTSVTIPNSVTHIGESAFAHCISLKKVMIPDSVTFIGEYAFGYYVNENSTIEKLKDFIIYGTKGSTAETYAVENGFTFIPIPNLEDTDSGVSISVTDLDLLAENTALQVKTVETTESKMIYDIALTANGTPIQPAAPVTVKIPVPATMDGADCKVYRQEADGTYTDMQAIYQDGYMVFTTDHFSIYVLTVKDPNAPAITMGDINGDGVINAVDARWALQSASGVRTLSDEQFAAADVNGDGKITAVDARWILQAASGVRVL